MLAVAVAWSAALAFLVQLFLLLMEHESLSIARFSSIFSVLFVIGLLGASYYIVEAMAKEPESWLGKFGQLLLVISTILSVTIGGYAIVEGLNLLYNRTGKGFLILCVAVAFLACYYINRLPKSKT
jgi:hypothetical protein